MNVKRLIATAVAGAAMAVASQASQAATIVSGAEYVDGAAGTYLGSYNPLAGLTVPGDVDNGTFQHTNIGGDTVPGTDFNDFWVFDLAPVGGSGSVSADFTRFTAILNFNGALWTAGAGTTCGAAAGSGCTAVAPGMKLLDATASTDRWEIVASNLSAGRYIIQVTGTSRTDGISSYSGQLAFVPEPGTLALLGMGLLAIGASVRRRTN